MARVSVQEALRAATTHFERSDLDAARDICEQIVAQQPDQADAIHLLGLIAGRRGDVTGALELISRAISLQPATAHFHVNLGNELQNAGRYDDAIDAYWRALALRAEFPEAINNLAN